MTESRDPADWREINLEWWDERARIHATGDSHDLAGVREGIGGLAQFEWDEIGSVDGLQIVHPQCHIGTDTVSLARAGAASVVGLDFAPSALEIAVELARSVEFDDRCSWIEGDVYDASAAVEGRVFDLVYTGKGSVGWLPDINRWAAVMASLIRPGGSLYLAEFHPLFNILGDDIEIEHDYFQKVGEVLVQRSDGGGLHAPGRAKAKVWFNHTIGSVVTALIDQGLTLRFLHEHDVVVFERWPWLDPVGHRLWRVPTDRPSIPLMYSLIADR